MMTANAAAPEISTSAAAPVVPVPAETHRKQPRNLSPVIAIIPPTCYDNPTWKGLAYVARDIVVHGAVLTGLALTDRWYLLLPLFVLSAFSVSGLFILGHDAAHGSLFHSNALNAFIGRLTMLPSLHVYESWVFGHNRLHHGHTARQGADFVWHPLTLADWQKLRPWQRALVRLEWSWLGAGIYYLRNVWFKMIRWQQPDSMATKIHKDQLLIHGFLLVSVGLSAWLGYVQYASWLGALWMVTKLVLIPAFLFMYTIAIVVYVHHIEPDIRWYPRGQWDKFKGQMEATTNLYMPVGLDFFFHNIMVHVPHHVDMRIPFYHLPEAAQAITAAFPDVVREGKMSLFDYARFTKQCKLYDFEKGQWGPYPS